VLTRNHRQEALSRAFVQAVAACAGVGVRYPLQDYGIDLSLHPIAARGRRYVEVGIALDVQIKSTTRAVIDEETVVYDLEKKAYDDLRVPDARANRILVLVVLPGDDAAWTSQTEDALTIYGKAYWISLRGAPPSSARKSVRIRIPRMNAFSAWDLRNLFGRLKQGEAL
jgi:hypothetical protein